MLAGMSVVFVFLALMMFLVHVLAYLTRHRTAEEFRIVEQQRKKRMSRGSAAHGNEEPGVPLAVISAAIVAFEQDLSAP